MTWQSPVSPSVPELLAPAGDWDCAKAAVANGADAIYFGLDTGFNARARATNFSLENCPNCSRSCIVTEWRATSPSTSWRSRTSWSHWKRRCAGSPRRGRMRCSCRISGLVRVIRRVAPESVDSRVDADVADQCRVHQQGAAAGDRARRAGPRAVGAGDRQDPQPDHRAAGGVRPRGDVRGVQRPVPDERIAGRAQCESRPVCARPAGCPTS